MITYMSENSHTYINKHSEVAQLCPTCCDPMNYTVHGILQARILEWVAFPFSRGSSQPRDWTQVSCTACGFFTSWATRKAHINTYILYKCMEYINFRTVLQKEWREVVRENKGWPSVIRTELYFKRFSKSEKSHRKMLRYIKYYLISIWSSMYF